MPQDRAAPPATLAQNTTDAVTALLERRLFEGRWLQVELRGGRTPVAVLWQQERPIAMHAAGALAISRTAARFLRELLITEARDRAISYEQIRERQLRLLIPPNLTQV